ncbi:hypothetical protein JCM8097_007527 [Rhodosporidiobolus ruineniae]
MHPATCGCFACLAHRFLPFAADCGTTADWSRREQFKTEEDAVQIANDSEYGLAAAVHSLNINTFNRVVRRLKAGTVWANQYVMLSHAVPFGGYKQSGWGRDLGSEA